MTVAPLSYTWAQSQTTELSDHQWTIGDVSVGGEYDTLLGVIFNAQYARALGNDWAMGLVGEYGPNQYRLNGTIARALWENAEIKFTTDYLSQVLPFEFDSGDIDQRVRQTAYGVELQQNLQHSIFQNVNFGGYRSASANVSLSDITYTSGDTSYTNQRNIAGAVAQGIDLGTELKLSTSTLLDTKLLYDDVNYNTDFTEDSVDDAARFGGAVELQQVLSDRLKASFSGEVRAIYNTYGSKLSWAPEFGQPLGLRLSLSAQRLISHNQTANSNSYGLECSLFNDDATQSPNYALASAAELPNLIDWVKDPAVYMERVLAVAEQKTTANVTPTPVVPTPATLASAATVGVPSGVDAPVTYTSPGSIAWLGSDTSSYTLYNVSFLSAAGVTAITNGYTLPTGPGVYGAPQNLGSPSSMTSTTMTSSASGTNINYTYAFICQSGKTTYNTSYCTNYVQTTP